MSTIANMDKKQRAGHFAVETARIHRATCEKVQPEAEALTAMQAQRLSKPSATCCRPNQSAEWKATLATRQSTIAHVEIANPKNPADVPLFGGLADVAAAYLKAGTYAAFVTVPEGGDHGPETGNGTLTIAKDGTYTLTMEAASSTAGRAAKKAEQAEPTAPAAAPKKRAPRKPRQTGGAAMTEQTAKAILALPVEDRIAAGLAAGKAAAEKAPAKKATPKKAAAPAPADKPAPTAGETVDMGGKRVRAGATTVAYVSKTLSESGKSIVRCEWKTDAGVTIVQERGRWTVGGKDAPEVKTLAAAVALAG